MALCAVSCLLCVGGGVLFVACCAVAVFWGVLFAGVVRWCCGLLSVVCSFGDEMCSLVVAVVCCLVLFVVAVCSLVRVLCFVVGVWLLLCVRVFVVVVFVCILLSAVVCY